MIVPTIDQLRKDMDSARTDLARIEGQQESAQEELTRLEAESRELGFEPENLSTEANRIMGDVNEALVGVRREVEALVGRTGNAAD